MKTYFLITLFVCGFICGLPSKTFAAHDDTFAQINSSQAALYAMTLEQQLAALTQAQTQNLSWKQKTALKIAKQKIAKAERKIKQGKKANSLGGAIIALVVIGALLIPLGILLLLPLLIVGVVLLALGIVGSVFRGISRAFWW
jgi:hypothetical protein